MYGHIDISTVDISIPRWLFYVFVLALAAFALALAMVLYYALRERVPGWLLLPMIFVLVPVSTLAALIGGVVLIVVLFMLRSAGYG